MGLISRKMRVNLSQATKWKGDFFHCYHYLWEPGVDIFFQKCLEVDLLSPNSQLIILSQIILHQTMLHQTILQVISMISGSNKDIQMKKHDYEVTLINQI